MALKETVGVLEAVMPLGVALVLEEREAEGDSRALEEGEALRLGEGELLGQAEGLPEGEGGAVALADRLLQPTEDTLWLGICGALGPPTAVCECVALTVREEVLLREALPQPDEVALRLGVVEPLAQPEALTVGAGLRDCDTEPLLQ